LVHRFFDRDGFPERARYYTGEMIRHFRDAPTLGSGLAPDVRVTYRPLHRSAQRAAFAATLSDSVRAFDWYLYLERVADRWTLRAVRSLAMPVEFHALLDSLSAMASPPDSLARLRDRMDLATRSDSALAAHLRANAARFDELASLVSAAPSVELVGHDGQLEPRSAHDAISRRTIALLRELGLSSVYRSADYPGCLFLGIVAVSDNELGYLYAPPGCREPAIDPELFIYVERVIGPWYVYKTT
jgi:hypothetical protein